MNTLPLDARLVFEHIPLGLLIIEDDMIRFANTVAHDILDEVVLEGKPITTLLPNYGAERIAEIVREHVPLLAQTLAMNERTQVMVVRYAGLDLPSLQARFWTDSSEDVAGILDQIKNLEQTSFEFTTYHEMLAAIKKETLLCEERLWALAWLQHIYSDEHYPEMINLDLWLDSKINFWQQKCATKNIKFHIPTKNLGSSLIVHEALDTIIEELLTNAFWSVDEGGRIEFGIETTQHQLTLYVKDSGAGFGTEQRLDCRPFEPFTSCWKEPNQFVGIGLNIVAAWVERLDGVITWQTEQGFLVQIELPLQPPEINLTHQNTLQHLLDYFPLPLIVHTATGQIIWQNQLAINFFKDWKIYNSPYHQPKEYMYEQRFGPIQRGELESMLIPEHELWVGIVDQTMLFDGLAKLAIMYNYDITPRISTARGFSELLKQFIEAPPLEAPYTLDTLLQQAILFSTKAREYRGLELGHSLTLNRSLDQRIIDEDIEAIRKEITQQCTKRKISLHIEQTPSLVIKQRKRLHIGWMLKTLLDNAIQASPEGGRVSLDIRAWEEGVLFEITDQGCGIPAAEIPLIYQYFWRNPNNYVAPKREYQTGIELALLKKIVRQLGGWLRHESSETGTTARMWLLNIEKHPDS